MGITIHYRFMFMNEKALEMTLMLAKRFAEKLGMEILRFNLSENKKELIISPDEKCETINLVFQKWKDVKKQGKKEAWVYEYAVLGDFKIKNWKGEYEDLFEDNDWVCAEFTKTQFAGAEVHSKVCEVLRIVASFSSWVDIFDEGEYYETLDYQNLVKNIEDLGKFINMFANALSQAGLEVSVGEEIKMKED